MATIELELSPWRAPNFATVKEPPGKRQDGFKEVRSIPVAELSASALRQMAQEWLKDLYDKAGKEYDWRFD